MAGDETERNQGLPEAHTPRENFGGADPDRAAKIGATAAATEAAMADLAAQIGGSPEAPEQQSLLLDEMDEQLALFAGPVRHVAETISAARNGRGRPKGSQNKASRQFAETLQRMGYRHPGLNLAALANADKVGLAIELAGMKVEGDPMAQVADLIDRGKLTRGEAISLITNATAIITKANAELLPYFESKAPTKVEVDERIMGMMVIGEMKAQPPDDGMMMSLTRVDKPE